MFKNHPGLEAAPILGISEARADHGHQHIGTPWYSLVRSHLNTISVSGEDRGTFPCGRSRCNTCTHTNASPTINTPGGCITITSRYTCISQNVVYVIKCCTCNKIYIGETGRRLGDRFREHLRSTRQANTDLPVGRHFASPSHACTDMLVSVIRSGF